MLKRELSEVENSVALIESKPAAMSGASGKAIVPAIAEAIDIVSFIRLSYKSQLGG